MTKPRTYLLISLILKLVEVYIFQRQEQARGIIRVWYVIEHRAPHLPPPSLKVLFHVITLLVAPLIIYITAEVSKTKGLLSICGYANLIAFLKFPRVLNSEIQSHSTNY